MCSLIARINSIVICFPIYIMNIRNLRLLDYPQWWIQPVDTVLWSYFCLFKLIPISDICNSHILQCGLHVLPFQFSYSVFLIQKLFYGNLQHIYSPPPFNFFAFFLLLLLFSNSNACAHKSHLPQIIAELRAFQVQVICLNDMSPGGNHTHWKISHLFWNRTLLDQIIWNRVSSVNHEIML